MAAGRPTRTPADTRPTPSRCRRSGRARPATCPSPRWDDSLPRYRAATRSVRSRILNRDGVQVRGAPSPRTEDDALAADHSRRPVGDGPDRAASRRVRRRPGRRPCHNSVAFTLTRYGGLFEDGSDAAVDRLDALLAPPQSGPPAASAQALRGRTSSRGTQCCQLTAGAIQECTASHRETWRT